MTAEITALALAALLQCAQFLAYSAAANLQVGPEYATGPRDAPRALTGMAGRLQRALANHFEGLILFTIAVVVVTLSGQQTSFTAGCAFTYVAARLLYVPAYAFGWTPWRSVIWGIGWAATLLMLLAALF